MKVDKFGRAKANVAGSFVFMFLNKDNEKLPKDMEPPFRCLKNSFAGWFLSPNGPAELFYIFWPSFAMWVLVGLGTSTGSGLEGVVAVADSGSD